MSQPQRFCVVLCTCIVKTAFMLVLRGIDRFTRMFLLSAYSAPGDTITGASKALTLTLIIAHSACLVPATCGHELVSLPDSKNRF
ncbi:hypothetical protein FPV67DRAFT_1505743 [Lyophyllum atratum]|nr:hypothetical protein FPV67DRAFT_1505743 [Lyophyllum atratum]